MKYAPWIIAAIIFVISSLIFHTVFPDNDGYAFSCFWLGVAMTVQALYTKDDSGLIFLIVGVATVGLSIGLML